MTDSNAPLPPSPAPQGAQPAFSAAQPPAPVGQQPSYPVAPAQQYPSSAPVSRDAGKKYWLMFLLYYVPVVGFFLVPIIEAVMRGNAKNASPAEEANSRGAVNWALTWLGALVLSIVTIITLILTTGQPGPSGGIQPPESVGILAGVLMMVVLFIGGILTLIQLIVGAVRAGRGEAFRGFGIPFVRAPRADRS